MTELQAWNHLLSHRHKHGYHQNTGFAHHHIMHLSDYLRRINYAGPIAPTYPVLCEVHRAHLLGIPYENLDIHLDRQLSLDIETIYDKIVNRRRGGWCFEMNSLLAWALRKIGFDVQMVSGAVNRDRLGDLAEGNHIVLLVHLDQTYVADAGFGIGFYDPLPLAESEFSQNGFTYSLEHRGKRWVFHNQAFDGFGYDFTVTPRRIEDFAARCQWLQTSPDSGFVRLTSCNRLTPAGYLTLRGLMLESVTPHTVNERVIEDIEDYRAVLRDQFDLELGGDIDQLWPKVRASHRAWVDAGKP
jgi:N-hydroxyarylamine O-acetyltransferase